jgi:hypothetical protein
MDIELKWSGCDEFAFAYIDDILIASDTYEEHVEHVRRVLEMLKACKLRIHPDKSVFGTNVIEYLGHNVVGQHGITMNDAKVQAIKALPTPANVPQLRSILGFMAYYRHFIPGYSVLTAPMNDLLKKDIPWKWGAAQHSGYQELKRLMTKPGKLLRRIDPDRPLILHTDWSAYGIGAILGQCDDDGREYLCACISRSLNKHERNYPSYKGELLALAWAIRMFRQHLFGTTFTAVTDHQPLLWLMRARDLNGQYARWQVLLQEYDFEVKHRAGIKHTNADVLSRFPRQSTRDLSGARFDEEFMERMLQKLDKLTPQRALPLIDSFAPRFSDLFDTGVNHVTETSYMDGAMHDTQEPKDPTVNQLYPERKKARVAFCMAVSRLLTTLSSMFHDLVNYAVNRGKSSGVWKDAKPLVPGHSTHAIDTSIVGPRFFPAAAKEGVQLIELCAGINTGLDALLRAGVKVHAYCYVDRNPVARTVAKHRLSSLSAMYPKQFPPTAWACAFDLPQDLRNIDVNHLLEWQESTCAAGAGHAATMIIAGWPCQDYSPAGHGRIGQRAAMLQEVLRVVRFFQMSQATTHNPVAYILENVPLQLNFRHEHVRWPVWHDLVSQLHLPVTFDAVQVGAHAHRLRNYWTNLVDTQRAQQVFDGVKAFPTVPLQDIL